MTMSDTQLDLARYVVDLVGDRGEAQVRVTRQNHGLTRFANSFIHQHVGEDVATVALTVAVDGRVSSASTSNLDPDALSDFVDAAVAAAQLQPQDPFWPGLAEPTEIPALDQFDAATASALPAQRAERVREFVDAGPELRAAGYLDTEATRGAFANSAGHTASGRTTRASLDGIHQTDSSAGSAHQTSFRVDDLDAVTAGVAAAETARRSSDFVDIEPGEYEVVLAPEAVASIAIFLSVYGFNAKTHLEGGSFAEVGEQQFDASFTLVDDPTDPRSVGMSFDAEGTPKGPLVLVEDGVTRSLAHDRRTARRMDTVSTGHALPGAAGFGPVATDLIVSPGDASRQDLIADVESGLFVTQFHYCRILDPRTQVMTGLTRNGTFLIQDGEITQAVGNLRFTQSVIEALGEGRILGIGDDQRYANSEFGAGAVMTPSLHLAAWNFSGGAKG